MISFPAVKLLITRWSPSFLGKRISILDLPCRQVNAWHHSSGNSCGKTLMRMLVAPNGTSSMVSNGVLDVNGECGGRPASLHCGRFFAFTVILHFVHVFVCLFGEGARICRHQNWMAHFFFPRKTLERRQFLSCNSDAYTPCVTSRFIQTTPKTKRKQ